MKKINLVEKTLGKWKLWTIISAVLIVVGIVIACVFGFNPAVDMASVKTVTVEYPYVAKVETLESVCETSFADSGVKYLDKKVAGSYTGEVVYYFDLNADTESAVVELQKDLDEAMKEGGALSGSALIKARTNKETFQEGLTDGFALRAGIALAVFAVAAFVYVALRYKLSAGITMTATMLVAIGLTVSLTALTRIPVSASFAAAALVAGLASVVMALITFNRFRDNAKDKEKEKDKTSYEKVLAAVDTKKVLILAAALTLALVLLGAIVPTARWFALAAFVGVVAATFAGWIFAPSLLVVLDKAIKPSNKPLFKAKKKDKKSKTAEESVIEEDVQA